LRRKRRADAQNQKPRIKKGGEPRQVLFIGAEPMQKDECGMNSGSIAPRQRQDVKEGGLDGLHWLRSCLYFSLYFSYNIVCLLVRSILRPWMNSMVTVLMISSGSPVVTMRVASFPTSS